MFTTRLGGRVTPMAPTKALSKLAVAAQISTTRLNDTRHTAASRLIVGCRTDARTAASVLGHATPNVTLSVYARLFADAQRAALNGLGKRLERIYATTADGDSALDLASDGHGMATASRVKKKNARKNARSMVEARRLELGRNASCGVVRDDEE